MNNNKQSIIKINFSLFFILIFFNTLMYYFIKLWKYNFLFLIINTIILLIFIFLNNKFESELLKYESNIKNVFNSSWHKNKFQNNLNYIENEKTYKIFKNVYIKKNILTKDFNDLKEVFLKLVPEAFFNEVNNKWLDKIGLWITVKKHLNIMFLDIIWFTSITEKIPPDRALLLLNVYFDWIVEIIKSNWWYVDKFLWDGIMIIFDNENSDNAIKSSVEIQEFIKKFQISSIWKKISIWIWINSWDSILWTIWSKNRMEITVIWDTVNTASRIEWLTRKHKENILIAESTYNKLKNKDLYKIIDLWEKTIRWKKIKVKIYWIDI